MPGDSVLWTEERDQLHTRRVRQQLNRRFTLESTPARLVMEPHMFSAQEHKLLRFQYVQVGLHAPTWLSARPCVSAREDWEA